MPTCRTEMIFISNLRATFCAKHHFTVTKRTNAIKLLCKNVAETFNSKDFFSILLTKYFLILKQFSRFWNLFFDSEIFFSILKFFSRFRNIFLDFNLFFLDSVIVFLDFINFFWLWNIFVDSKFFFLIMKIFSRFWKFFLDGGYQPDWLLLTFSCVYTINWVLLIPLWYSCMKNVIHEIDSKDEWLFFSVPFTVKLQLVFVLTLENPFFRVFILKATKRA